MKLALLMMLGLRIQIISTNQDIENLESKVFDQMTSDLISYKQETELNSNQDVDANNVLLKKVKDLYVSLTSNQLYYSLLSSLDFSTLLTETSQLQKGVLVSPALSSTLNQLHHQLSQAKPVVHQIFSNFQTNLYKQSFSDDNLTQLLHQSLSMSRPDGPFHSEVNLLPSLTSSLKNYTKKENVSVDSHLNTNSTFKNTAQKPLESSTNVLPNQSSIQHEAFELSHTQKMVLNHSHIGSFYPLQHSVKGVRKLLPHPLSPKEPVSVMEGTPYRNKEPPPAVLNNPVFSIQESPHSDLTDSWNTSNSPPTPPSIIKDTFQEIRSELSPYRGYLLRPSQPQLNQDDGTQSSYQAVHTEDFVTRAPSIYKVNYLLSIKEKYDQKFQPLIQLRPSPVWQNPSSPTKHVYQTSISFLPPVSSEPTQVINSLYQPLESDSSHSNSSVTGNYLANIGTSEFGTQNTDNPLFHTYLITAAIPPYSPTEQTAVPSINELNSKIPSNVQPKYPFSISHKSVARMKSTSTQPQIIETNTLLSVSNYDTILDTLTVKLNDTFSSRFNATQPSNSNLSTPMLLPIDLNLQVSINQPKYQSSLHYDTEYIDDYAYDYDYYYYYDDHSQDRGGKQLSPLDQEHEHIQVSIDISKTTNPPKTLQTGSPITHQSFSSTHSSVNLTTTKQASRPFPHEPIRQHDLKSSLQPLRRRPALPSRPRPFHRRPQGPPRRITSPFNRNFLDFPKRPAIPPLAPPPQPFDPLSLLMSNGTNVLPIATTEAPGPSRQQLHDALLLLSQLHNSFKQQQQVAQPTQIVALQVPPKTNLADLQVSVMPPVQSLNQQQGVVLPPATLLSQIQNTPGANFPSQIPLTYPAPLGYPPSFPYPNLAAPYPYYLQHPPYPPFPNISPQQNCQGGGASTSTSTGPGVVSAAAAAGGGCGGGSTSTSTSGGQSAGANPSSLTVGSGIPQVNVVMSAPAPPAIHPRPQPPAPPPAPLSPFQISFSTGSTTTTEAPPLADNQYERVMNALTTLTTFLNRTTVHTPAGTRAGEKYQIRRE